MADRPVPDCHPGHFQIEGRRVPTCLPFSSRARAEARQKLIVPAYCIHPRILDKSMVELTIRWKSLGFTHPAVGHGIVLCVSVLPKKKRRSTEVNRHLPVNSKSLIGCSQLAFMTANNDPLGVEFCLSVSRGRTRKEGPFGFRQYAKLAFSIGPLPQP
jgi:hypothetical protein